MDNWRNSASKSTTLSVLSGQSELTLVWFGLILYDSAVTLNRLRTCFNSLYDLSAKRIVCSNVKGDIKRKMIAFFDKFRQFLLNCHVLTNSFKTCCNSIKS